ncbi:MAG: Excinuclease ABC C subunit domain protein [Candidatus Adlerbacteria bacterium GW2011_GWA1_54_10]|uniref:Excinuclease ABC C subunit domain protein n=2 Tax=Candidatus Adleribacteriota TaxID=1752736 RepID=A0A0G2AT27_9BACT|nr:MAG: Excinuclease ABC C subunit domain protein [Candidatus Adlerbacteria bacterium GW2011_GWA1_54_10]KKW37575.1 MAG: Excinuclease ABC C subunit domain protein [Candidatus Adlerbacteria bacterium GW2011_GWB1_54_7]
MKWFVYIAQAASGYYYVGISPNPKERIICHNAGAGSQMARQHGSFELVYSSAPFPNKSEARKREIQLKGWSKEKKLKLIKGEWK